ncbi:MAG: hypothetical protein PHR81_06740 [Bacteroidales bacterium]|jgi:hypothetical protein|nr:hypothetical protein [Bacteroidales bacterium]MDD4214492.1 hypothetical protein [Bacteroidales bacterium]
MNLFTSKLLSVLLFTFIAYSTNLYAQSNTTINPIAKKYFTARQADSLSKSEIRAVNYMFTSSYIVDTTTSVYKKWIKENGDIDIVLLKPQRKKSERTFYRNEKYPGFVIEFLSRDEVEAKINSILNTPKSKNQ